MSSALNSLGLAKSPADSRIVVAMSGGVDSSVVAALLASEGYQVIGITLQLYDQAAAVERRGACCAGQDIYDARRVAERLNFPHYVLDYESRFREGVIDDFADAYLRGETPIPCVRCNQTVKFRDLLAAAQDLQADALATGHYIRRVETADGPALYRAEDQGKDQSYFLFATTRSQLDWLRFPLGSYSKAETRALAQRFDLSIADKPDSQDICFVPDGDYAKLVAKLRPEAQAPGEIVHISGEVLGRHNGIIHYTIGQRRGLGVGGQQDPLYVVRLEPATRRVVVGPREALARQAVYLKQVNWLGTQAAPSAEGWPVSAKLRSVMAPVPGRFFRQEQGRGLLLLDSPEHGVAPGQAAVLYDGERLLGGGWIEGAEVLPARQVA